MLPKPLRTVAKKINNKRCLRAKAKRLVRAPSLPIALDVETTSLCQLDCIRCPRREMTRGHGSMTVEQFGVIMEKLGGCAYKLWMHLFGDPLLTPGLPEMIGLAKAAGIDNVGMSTNALALSPETGRALCRAGVDTLILSLDATTQDVYNIVRAGGKLDKAVENCERLLMLPERKSIRNLVIQFIEMPENKHQAADFIKRWSGKGARVHIKKMDSWASHFEDVLDKDSPQKDRQPCDKLWTTLSIDWHGDATICCRDFDLKTKIGNIFTDPVESIWNGPEIRAIRRSMVQNDYGSLALCGPCPEWAWVNGVIKNREEWEED